MWYDFTLFILEESTPGWEVFNSAARYRAWQRQELSRFVENVGFQEVQWQMPDESGFYQPVITAVKGV
jgi:glycine/sarcosine N-methyltransferase